MNAFSHEQLGPCLYRIRDAFNVGMYLVVGQERCALIDTGYGFVGLRGYVESLCSLPVTVLLTHAHIDHAFGIYEFADHPIYLHPAEDMVYANQSRSDFHEAFLHNIPHYGELPMQPIQPVTFLPMNDGDVFDLGGIHIQALHVPGHTSGSVVLLIPELRVCVFGDACGPGTLVLEDSSPDIATYRAALLRLKQHEAEYDVVLRNHGSGVSGKDVLDNVIEVCDEILAGCDDKVPMAEKARRIFTMQSPTELGIYTAKRTVMSEHGAVRADGREGNINYRADKVPRRQ